MEGTRRDKSYFEQQVDLCKKKFVYLYRCDEYISENYFEKFLDEYADILRLCEKYIENPKDIEKMKFLNNYGYRKIKIHNENYISKKINEDKEYFDHIFDEVDKNICLDENQRKAILIDDDYSVIVAGAGSGKISTIAAKIKYLLEKKNIKEEKIVIVCFSKKSAFEFEEKLVKKFNLNVKITTIQKLLFDFVEKITSENITVISEKTMYNIISKYVTDNLFVNKELLQKFRLCFREYLLFDNTCMDYQTYDEFYEQYMKRKLEESKENLDEENNRRILGRENIKKTIKGEFVRSVAECRIANYLYLNGISYEYDHAYNGLENEKYIPCFTIHNSDTTLYIEYYEFAKLCNNEYVESDSYEYKNDILNIKKIHEENNTNLIELYGRYEDGTNYMSNLEKKLCSNEFVLEKRNSEDVLKELLITSKDSLYISFIHLMIQFIKKWKELGYSKEEFEHISLKTDDSDVKKQLELTKYVFDYYDDTLKQNNEMDYQDIINLAYKSIDEQMQGQLYDYLIVDDYQDVSVQISGLVEKLSKLYNCKVIAAEDDWRDLYLLSFQTANSFSNFYDLMNYNDMLKLTEYMDKLKENIKNEERIRLVFYNDDKVLEVSKLIDVIYQSNHESSILLLGNSNLEIDNLVDSGLFYKNDLEKIVCSNVPNAKVEFSTWKKVGGYDYDEIIVLDSIDNIEEVSHPEPRLLGVLSNFERIEIDYPDERKILSVALSRTKSKIYILTPEIKKEKYSFAREKDYKKIEEEI